MFKYILITFFSLNCFANSLELGLGINLPNKVNMGPGLSYNVGYNLTISEGYYNIGATLAYNKFDTISYIPDIRGIKTNVAAEMGKLGYYVNTRFSGNTYIQLENGLLTTSLSKTTVTPTGGTLNGAYIGTSLLMSVKRIKPKISYTLDYAENESNQLGIKRFMMHSFKVGVLIEL